jgi:hypothetical protein
LSDDEIYSLGSDNQIIKYQIVDDKIIQNYTLKFTHIFGDFDYIYFNDQNDMIIFGFYGKNFIIYNYTKRYRVFFILIILVFIF